MTPAASLLAELVAIESVNPSLAANGSGEGAIAAFCAAWLERHGFEVHRLERHPGRPSIVGVARGTGGGRSLMLNGHVDTVGVAGYEGDPLVPEVRDGRMHGRGTYDMKSGVAAAMVAAARATREGTLRGDVVVALVADEEHTSLGTEEVLAAGFTADAAIVCEPTNLEIVGAHKGWVWLEIEIIGRAAHGSRPDLGIDAIAKAGHALVALERYQARLAAGSGHPVLGTGSVHAGIISGGVEASTYPERCRFSIERRTIPGETAATVEAEVRAMLDAIAATDPDFSWRLAGIAAREPWEGDRGSAVYRSVMDQATRALGRPPVERGEPFWTDAQLLDAAGIPALLFGAVGAGAHATTEWIDLASLETLVQVLEASIADICG